MNNTVQPQPQPEPQTAPSIDSNTTPQSSPQKDDKVVFSGEQQAAIEEMLKQRLDRERKRSEAEKAEAAKLAEMSAQEKASYERDKLQQELDKLKQQTQRYEMGREATKILGSSGITVDEQILEFVVRDTAEETHQAVIALTNLINAKAEEMVKQQLAGTPPKIMASGAKAMTYEEIMQITDRDKRQQQIANNPHLFSNNIRR